VGLVLIKKTHVDWVFANTHVFFKPGLNPTFCPN